MFKKIFLMFLLSSIFSCEEKAKDNFKKPVPAVKEKKDLYAGLSYSIITERKSKVLKSDSLKKIVNAWLSENTMANIEELTDYILKLTANQLNFSFGKCSSDPTALIKKREANCVGYAAFFNALMNYALQQKSFGKEYVCKHYVAKIYFAGQNINALFNDPFFKDHDFNVIRSADGKTEIAVDPSLYEYLNVRRVLVKR